MFVAVVVVLNIGQLFNPCGLAPPVPPCSAGVYIVDCRSVGGPPVAPSATVTPSDPFAPNDGHPTGLNPPPFNC